METLMFRGKEYKLAQFRDMEETDNNPISPLSDWFANSSVGEFTRYYSDVIFHCSDGFFAASRNDLTNFCGI